MTASLVQPFLESTFNELWEPRQVLEWPVFWRLSDRGEPTKSASRRRAEAALWRDAKAGGLAQSKTLPRNPRVYGPVAWHKSRGALHEPQSAAGILPAEESEESSADETSAAPCWRHRPPRSTFKVPMHGIKVVGPFPAPRTPKCGIPFVTVRVSAGSNHQNFQ